MEGGLVIFFFFPDIDSAGDDWCHCKELRCKNKRLEAVSMRHSTAGFHTGDTWIVTGVALQKNVSKISPISTANTPVSSPQGAAFLERLNSASQINSHLFLFKEFWPFHPPTSFKEISV